MVRIVIAKQQMPCIHSTIMRQSTGTSVVYGFLDKLGRIDQHQPDDACQWVHRNSSYLKCGQHVSVAWRLTFILACNH